MREYNHKAIESKWQKEWEKQKLYEASEDPAKKKTYLLVEFPYPSGAGLHTGHVRSYTAMDVVARKRRAQGENVLYPMGWDAFGLPTENYAVKTGTPPKVVTKENTDIFRRQLKSLGFSFDWSREINTTDPSYYKWTQWIFLRLFKKGLAYKASRPINWCLSCKIGLADEEVIGGMCERCGGPTEKREKEQWMLAITKYADRLDKDLDDVDYLPRVKIQQRNWIGRSEGAEITFVVQEEKEPTFYQFFEPGTIHDGELFVERNAIIAIVKHWSEDKYIGLKWKKVNWETLITGGIEKGHNAEEAAVQEIREETGYRNPKLVKNLGRMHSKFFHVPKKENRFGHFDIVCFELENGERDDLSEEEKGNHEPQWLTPAEMDAFGFPSSHKYVWEKFKNDGKPRKSAVTVFTTRPDTLFGATYLVLAPEHPLASHYIHQASNAAEIDAYITNAAQKTDIERTNEGREKTGVELKGITAINPANSEAIPIWIADSVLAHYGTGAIMAVPAHDERDFVFAKKFSLPIRQVIQTPAVIRSSYPRNTLDIATGAREDVRIGSECWTGGGVIINSGQFDGMESENAKKAIVAFVGGEMKTTYKLRDWVFSRQRYWGEPLPLVFCEACRRRAEEIKNQKSKIKNEEGEKCSQGELMNPGWIAVSDESLPVVLPEVGKYTPTDTGESPLAAMEEWVKTTCPRCKGEARRETDTMPNWAGSSWYFLRYTDPHNDKQFAGTEKLKYWTPIDWYNGGMEHTTLHLLYSRFWHKFLCDEGLVPTSEPYLKRTSHGLILAEGGEKMSKSRGNVVNPDDIVERLGADTLRVYEMFMGPFDQAISWSSDGIIGPRRFLEKVWRLQEKIKNQKSKIKNEERENSLQNKEMELLMHQTVKKVSDDIEAMKFNTAVSQLMIMVNAFERAVCISTEHYALLVRLLAPFAPHISEELWSVLGNTTSVHAQPWPSYDGGKIPAARVVLVIQVNGRVRGTMPSALVDPKQSDVEEQARALPGVAKWLAGKEIQGVVYVKNKLINFVLQH